MSNFQQISKHPITGKMQLADWFDLGERHYVVRFPDGQRFCETEIEAVEDEPNTALTDCFGACKDNPIKRGE